MLIFEILIVALASLRANAMRSMLTMLGVIIGVAAVITMVALGEGAQAAVRDQLAPVVARRVVHRGLDQLEVDRPVVGHDVEAILPVPHHVLHR